MPKVNADYVEQKRNKILNAAFEVAMRKPMHEVSMRDVISESGLSQGGIYRYFSNIDDIYIALINRESTCYDVKNQVDSAIEDNSPPEKIILRLFLIWKKVVLDNLVGVGKIHYELSTIYASDKKRLSNYSVKIRIASEEAYIQEKSMAYIARNVNDGYFTPKQSIDDVFMFLMTSLNGLINSMILSKHYNIGEVVPIANDLDGDKAIMTLCTALVLLLGGNEKLIKGDIGG